MGESAPAQLAAQAQQLRRLHSTDEPLVLANVWDAASARLVAEAGFPVLATSSGAVAASLGHPDDDSMPVSEAFQAVRRIAAAADLPVTADLEAGYGLTAGELVRRLLDAGAVGCNLEDTDHHGSARLLPADQQAERLGAVKQAARAEGVDIVVNARVDVFRGGGEPDEAQLADAVARARLYVEAGADCVYPIMLSSEELISAFVAAVATPVNILLRGALTRLRLQQLGVRRISVGSALFRHACAATEQRARSLLAPVGA